MVMGVVDSCSEGFESQPRILDRHFFTFICCKNCNVCLKREKQIKRGRGGPFKSETNGASFCVFNREIVKSS